MNNKILFLGVGGIGVSALAIAAKRLGTFVVGYDISPNKLTDNLKSLGIDIFSDPNLIDVTKFSMIVYSSAIADTHPLLSKARELNIQCLQRAKFLAIFMKSFKNNIAITGTHGKTTTSSVLATLLQYLDTSSSFIVGGVVKHTNSNIEINGTDKLVIEADESDASFLHLNPNTIIVTNIDLDHMNTYDNSYDKLLENFYKFLNKRDVENIYLCIDDKGCQDFLEKYSFTNKNIITYGFSTHADVVISNYSIVKGYISFNILYNNQRLDFKTTLPGKYNTLNIVAGVINCLDLGFDYKQIKDSLVKIVGVARRFDVYKKTISNNKIDVIDDYGHHPVEVTNCINAVKDKYPDKKIIHIFQPHRYSRNRALFYDWLQALSTIDRLILLPTYAASEDVIQGAESSDLAKNLKNCTLVDSLDDAKTLLKKLVDDSAVVLIQGAGDITNLVEMLDE